MQIPLPISGRLLRLAWFLLLTFSLALYLIRLASDGPYGKDFTIFLTGAHLLIDGRAGELYSLGAQADVQHSLAGSVTYPGGVLPFNYPPYVAALFVPLTLVTPDIAYWLWQIVQWLVLIGWIAWVLRALRSWNGGVSDLLVMAIFSFAPIVEALLMGQMSLISVVLWWWAFASWCSGNQIHLGVSIALAAFKPQMAVLLIVALLAQKQWRALACAIVTQAVLWSAAIFVGGPVILVSYIDMLGLSASTVGTLGFYPEAMPNLRGLLTVIGIPTEITLWVSFVAWLGSAGLTFVIWRRTGIDLGLRFGALVLLAVLLSPHLYTHDASLLILAVVCTQLVGQKKSARALKILYVPFLLLFLSIYVLVLGIVSSYVPVILSLWLLGIVLALLLRQFAQAQADTGDLVVEDTAAKSLPTP